MTTNRIERFFEENGLQWSDIRAIQDKNDKTKEEEDILSKFDSAFELYAEEMEQQKNNTIAELRVAADNARQAKNAAIARFMEKCKEV